MEQAGTAAFGTIDATGLAVFSAIEVRCFTTGQVPTVLGHVTGLALLDALITTLQAPGLLWIEPAGGDAVVDAALLVVQTTAHFIDARMAGVDGAGALRNGEGTQHGGNCNSEKRFHGV